MSMSNQNTLRIGLTAAQTGETRGENGRWLPTVEPRPSGIKPIEDRLRLIRLGQGDLAVVILSAKQGINFPTGKSSESGERARQAQAQVQHSRTFNEEQENQAPWRADANNGY